MLIMIVSLRTKSSGLYRHRGVGFTQSQLQRRKSNIRIAKLVFHAKESPLRTRDEVLCLYLHGSIVRPKYIVRLSGYPLIQDSLRGSPDLPACGLQRGSVVAQYGPSSSPQVQDPREGPNLVGRMTQGLLKSGLARQAREEAERSRQGYLARCP